ncbi:glutamine amidotransferase [Edaphobacter sp. 12200R-103]|uniref:glutamine amidotransferase n=1 Tax=Edaphobacter sp. 12200R-103 TaxID=2703788 RepID=UPI00138B32CC|nr:glutamine amidotransferase [Edaphobacter sp. 12200R-103]QHS51739.1 glutamine amidotransferase [Edaphobacter sp. 12200R-103]
MKSVVAIRHVHFEDLGLFHGVLQAAGYEVRYLDAGTHDLSVVDSLSPNIMVILGGPVGVYDDETYPFLLEERRLLQRRLASNLPTVGICLGAQQIAAALGSRVAPSGGKEIGFAPVSLSPDGRVSALRHLEGVPVLHWHGDNLELPMDATVLASTPLCPNQAFSIGANILGLQFHPEANPANLEAWLIGHAAELASAGIDPRQIRKDAKDDQGALVGSATRMFQEWLANISA